MASPLDPNLVAKVHEAIKANKGKATLKEISKATNLPYRVVHNITWRMEGAPKGGTLLHREEATLKRVNLGRSVEYALLKRGEGTKFTPNMGGKYATKGVDPKEATPTK